MTIYLEYLNEKLIAIYTSPQPGKTTTEVIVTPAELTILMKQVGK